ncbi:MAG: SurA N-terminal domain-containing protein, partial [Gammaproteobacteria bacterium]
MKFLPPLIGLLLAFSVPLLQAQTAENPPAEREVLNQIVAIVNDDVILKSELDTAVKDVSAQLKEKDTPLPTLPVLEKQVLEKLILEHLQLQLAEANGIKIDDITLNNKLQEIAKENGVSLTDFRSVLEREGFDYSHFRENIRDQLTIAKLRQQMVGNRISASDQEVDNLLASLETSQMGNTEYHLAHILIATPDAASEHQIKAASQRAEMIVAKLRAGADFTQTAIAESDAPTALEGGDLGWRSAGQLP